MKPRDDSSALRELRQDAENSKPKLTHVPIGVFEQLLNNFGALTKIASDLIRTPPPKRLGRKSAATPEVIAQVLKMKQAGKTNNEIAKVLYETKTPTPSQRRSVPTRLKNWLKHPDKK